MLKELRIESVALRAGDILGELLQELTPVIIVFDLGYASQESVRCIEELRSADIGYKGVILCFGPHVATDTLASAERAGADLVVPNSVISARGARIIKTLLESS